MPFYSTKRRKFCKINAEIFEKNKDSEDTDCTFFDANGDGKQDLYVTSGGSEFSSSSTALLIGFT